MKTTATQNIISLAEKADKGKFWFEFLGNYAGVRRN